MSNEVRIKLTNEQKAKIHEATGKAVGEIRVSNLGNNPAVTPTTSPKVATARSAMARTAAARNVSAKIASARNVAAKVASARNVSAKVASARTLAARASNGIDS